MVIAMREVKARLELTGHQMLSHELVSGEFVPKHYNCSSMDFNVQLQDKK